eukprot:TRINITY_DN34586_c0_g2_i1.p1 TRINITY_DN34586_c0_g2~~TRINITY_DN34586_c0_g2_i1.p1  ORF type:complete len:510 (-),score=84.85 TRINITY_DN34586_c0_g2_i1:219-1748(-)
MTSSSRDVSQGTGDEEHGSYMAVEAAESDLDTEEGVLTLCRRIEETRRTMGISMFWYVLKWVVPGAVFASSFFFQNYCLHLGTYYYIQWMDRLEANLDNSTAEDADLSSRFAQGSLHDMSAQWLHHRYEVDMKVLDAVSAGIPMLWFFGTLYRLDVHLFTKCCLCGSLLAISKGLCDIITIVPDSIGWAGCKERLGDTGLKWFRDPSNLDFHKAAFASLKDLLYLEIIGAVRSDGKVRHLRFCADMVYSGHTYFCTLFSIGLYDLVRKTMRAHRLPGLTQSIILLLVSVVLTGVVVTDVALILMNKFHYALDCFLAVLIVYLFYTNGPVARVVQWWANEIWIPKYKHKAVQQLSRSGGRGELMIPPCCIWPPFCFMSGRYMILKEDDQSVPTHLMLNYLQETPERLIEVLRDAIPHARRRKRWSAHDLRVAESYLQECEEAVVKLKDECKSLNWENLTREIEGDRPFTLVESCMGSCDHWLSACEGAEDDGEETEGGPTDGEEPLKSVV